MTELLLNEIKSSGDALRYCLTECRRNPVDCAGTCELRKKWKIPPFSKQYPVEAKQE